MESGFDRRVERAAERLHDLAQKAADRGGLAGKLARPLKEDSQFLRKMKPSLVAARIRGEHPDDGYRPVVPPRPSPDEAIGGRKSDGPNPLPLVGAAAGAGILAAKAIDWRGHAHPRS